MTILERLCAAGIAPHHAQRHLRYGRVTVDGEVVTDPDAPADPPAVVALRCGALGTEDIPVTDDPLVPLLAEALVAEQHRRRTQRGWGAYTSPPVPNWAIDAYAEVTIPIWRRLVAEAVNDAVAALTPVIRRLVDEALEDAIAEVGP